jgi:hypothetical protein
MFLGASSVAAKHSKIAAYAFKTLAQGFDAEPIIRLTAHDILWGYDDKMIKLAAQFLPSLLPKKKFGFMERVSSVLTIVDERQYVRRIFRHIGKNNWLTRLLISLFQFFLNIEYMNILMLICICVLSLIIRMYLFQCIANVFLG